MFVSSLAAKVSFNVEGEGVRGKSVEPMTTVTIKGVNSHRANAGKNGEIMAKTLDQGKKFKKERYINANNIYSATYILTILNRLSHHHTYLLETPYF